MKVVENDRYTYRVTWSEEDREYVGLCAELKLSINLDVVLQAVDRLSLTPKVYIGIPKQCKTLNRRRKQIIREPKARDILYRDVYGWFNRVSRGVYELSPRGKQEIPFWREEAESGKDNLETPTRSDSVSSSAI